MIYKNVMMSLLLLTLAEIGVAQTHKQTGDKQDTVKNTGMPMIDKVKQEQIRSIMNTTQVSVIKLLSDTSINPDKKRVLKSQLLRTRTLKIDSIIGYKPKNYPHPDHPAGDGTAQKQ
jgi:hypothetical protein